jgi:alpha-beta hydrolase superfamily lysophospholipase
MYALFTASKPAIINPADEGKLVAVNNIVNAKSEIVEFRNAGVTFRGRAFLPENMDQCKGIVIFVHGLGYCVKAYQLDPKQFTSANYFLFTYNLRGHADSAGEWTLRRSVEDLKICVKWLNRKYSANKRLPIGILAHSTGALIGVLAALEEPLIQYASVVSPVTSIYDSFSHWHVSGYNQSVKPFFTTDGIIPPVIESYLDDFKVLLDYKEGRREREDLMVPYRYGMLKAESFTNLSDAIAYSPDLLTQTDQIKMPMIIFSGKYDEVINVEKIHRFHEQIKSAEKMLIPTESANHFLSESWSTIHKETIIFFNQILSRKD